MQRRGFLAGAAALGVGTALSGPWAAASERKQRILFFTRNVGYYHSVVQRHGDALSHAEQALVAMGHRAGIEVTCTKDGRVFDEDLAPFDAFVFFTNNDLTEPNPQGEPPMTADGKRRLLEAVAAGKGFVGLHSTCASWRTPPPAAGQEEKIDPFLAMLGGEFVAHGPQQSAVMRVTSPEFPGMARQGETFELMEEWYAMKNFAKDLHVILVQETRGMKGACYRRPPFPSTWARRHGKGKVFFTALAHREDTWSGEPCQDIVLGGLAWAMGNVEVDVTPNIDRVTPEAHVLEA